MADQPFTSANNLGNYGKKINSITDPGAIAQNVLKATADVAGLRHEGEKMLLQLLDPQAKCLFEMIMLPYSFLNTAWYSVKTRVMETIVFKVRVQTLDISFQALEYEFDGTYNYVKGIEPPGEITFTLLEDETSLVRNYLNAWRKEVYNYRIDEKTLREEIVFRDNQDSAKRNAIINLQTGMGAPTLSSVKLYGIKFKSMENLSLDQASPDPLMISVTCNVDKVEYKTLF